MKNDIKEIGKITKEYLDTVDYAGKYMIVSNDWSLFINKITFYETYRITLYYQSVQLRHWEISYEIHQETLIEYQEEMEELVYHLTYFRKKGLTISKTDLEICKLKKEIEELKAQIPNKEAS